MSLVVDAGFVVAALADGGTDGRWAEDCCPGPTGSTAPDAGGGANVLRRAALAGDISHDAAALAHADLVALRVTLFPYAPFAQRVWELRANVTAYDAWYVAVAEALDSELATVDQRLSRASGCRCAFLTPPG